MWEVFCGMLINWYYFFKMSVHLLCHVFLAEDQKVFEGGKFRNNDEETKYFFKKCFLSKRHLYQSGKVQNMPVVAGRLV